MEKTHFKLIHIAFIFRPQRGKRSLFLRKKEDYHYMWFEENDKKDEAETAIWATTTEEAIRLARKEWKLYDFTTLNCGFRYNLPERDEHGINALFHQMTASYGASNGVYFDEEVGHNCIVQNASIESRLLWQKLKEQNRI